MLTIQQFTGYIQRQFQYPVKTFQTDNESSLDCKFLNWVRQLGIALEFSYAPQQNSSAECSGGVLVAKARAIQIDSNLPEQLWPKAM